MPNALYNAGGCHSGYVIAVYKCTISSNCESSRFTWSVSYLYVKMHVYVCMYIIYIYIYICVCVCIHTYSCTYCLHLPPPMIYQMWVREKGPRNSAMTPLSPDTFWLNVGQVFSTEAGVFRCDRVGLRADQTANRVLCSSLSRFGSLRNHRPNGIGFGWTP